MLCRNLGKVAAFKKNGRRKRRWNRTMVLYSPPFYGGKTYYFKDIASKATN